MGEVNLRGYVGCHQPGSFFAEPRLYPEAAGLLMGKCGVSGPYDGSSADVVKKASCDQLRRGLARQRVSSTLESMGELVHRLVAVHDSRHASQDLTDLVFGPRSHGEQASISRVGAARKTARLACLDMAGTLISDGGVVMRAFQRALERASVTGRALGNAMEYASETMGQAKSDVFSRILGDPGQVALAMQAFDACVGEAIDAGQMRALPGAREALEQLRSLGVTTCLTTGFSRALQDRLVEELCWSKLVDFYLAPGEGVRGRPFPDMVLAAALRAQVEDVRHVAVAGDTVSDLWSGWRAGAGVVAGVLTGNDGRARLEAAPHTHIIVSIAEFPALVDRAGAGAKLP